MSIDALVVCKVAPSIKDHKSFTGKWSLQQCGYHWGSVGGVILCYSITMQTNLLNFVDIGLCRRLLSIMQKGGLHMYEDRVVSLER